MKLVGSIVTFAKVTLFFLNIYVLAVVLVVVLGQWRIFQSHDPEKTHDNSHLIVMRELKEEENLKPAVDQRIEHPVFKSDKDTYNPDIFEEEVSQRVKTMKYWCDKIHPKTSDITGNSPDKLHQILVDDKHKMLYCQIPEVAQTDWRRILIFLSGKVKVPGHLDISAPDVHSKYAKHLKKLSDFSPKDRKKRLKSYYKFLFVREPLERLVATYKHKFAATYSKYFHQMFGRKIIKLYRTKPSKESLQNGNDVTFSEFIQFVVDSDHLTEAPLNEHWQQYYKQCHPCLIQYDFVGKYETLNQDMRHVLKKTSALRKLTGNLSSTNLTNNEKTLNTFYKEISPSNLRRLWRIYYPDYSLFSYQYPTVVEKLLKTAKIFEEY